MISFISSFDIISIIILDQTYFWWITESTDDTATANSNIMNALSASAVSIYLANVNQFSVIFQEVF